MTLAHDLCMTSMERIKSTLSLDELHGPDGGPYRPLTSPAAGGASVGSLRLMSGGPVHKLVYIGLTVEAIGLDSHMLFAFSAPDSVLPHFTLDSVQAPIGPPGPDTPIMNAFHLDMIPRVDVAANLDYVDSAYGALEKVYEEAEQIEGLSKAHLSRRQWALMSPYMLANRATPEAFIEIGEVVSKYLDHWFDLASAGLDATGYGVDLSARDRAHRGSLFNADVDPVWGQVARIVGEDVSEELRLELVNQDMPTGGDQS